MYRYSLSYQLSFVLCISGTFILCRYYRMMLMMIIKPACCVCVSLNGRRWNSCVWSGCRLMSSFVRSVLVTVAPQTAPGHLEPVTVRGDTRLTRAATLYRPPARTVDEVVGASPTMHTLVMVSQLYMISSTIALYVLKTQIGKVGIFKSRVCSRCSKCFEFDFLKCNYWKTLKVGLFLT